MLTGNEDVNGELSMVNRRPKVWKTESQRENLANETANKKSAISNKELQTINHKLQTANMETHAHDLHKAPGHGWKHYFFEFFMLFLAVTLGFFVENLREHFNDRENVRRSVESLVVSLASDTTQLQAVINRNIKVVGHLDSLVQLRNADLNIEKYKRAFLKHSIVGFSEDWYFNTNDAALQQLKSSGTLRLIHKQNIVDSIFKYESKNKAIVSQQQDCYWLFRDVFCDYKKAVTLFFYRDTSVMKYSLGYDSSGVEFKNINAVSISADKEKVNILFGDAASMAAPDEAYIDLMQDQLAYGKRLIAFLKKEYDLKKE